MIPLFSTSQIREIDNYGINDLGIPGIVLMENASLEIFNLSKRKFSSFGNADKIGFICGKGNNGGDGFAAARHFANDGYRVEVLHIGDAEEMSPDCKANFNILKKLSLENKEINIHKYSALKDLNRLKSCKVIFDAMLGSGIEGSLKEPYKAIVNEVNKFKGFKIAIDIPIGLDSDKGYAESSFIVDLTITLGEFKKGLFFGDGPKYAGEVVKGNIGVSFSLFNCFETKEYLIEPEDAFDYLPIKEKSIHKYSAGKVLTIAGSFELPGAAVLTSKAALRVGAGASILAFPKSARQLIQKKLAEVIVKTYDDNNSGILSEGNLNELNERIKWADVLAIGPGLGRDEKTQSTILKIIKQRRCDRMVIDADAVFALNNKYKNFNLKNLVLTPHHGEFSNLIGIELNELKKDILKYGYEFVEQTGSYLVLKGAPTIIFTPGGEALINSAGNPGLAKFGTGDVLTGTIAGLLAQQKNIEKGVVAGVYIHSLAADLLLKDFTEYGYTATNIINNLPSAIKFLRRSFA